MHEEQPLLSPTGRTPRHRMPRWLRAWGDKLMLVWPKLSLLVLPHTLGLMQSVQIPAEVDAIRSLSCAHYYALHPVPSDKPACLDPAVERHFSRIATLVTFSVVLANFFTMLVLGRLFRHHWRSWMAVTGLCGCAIARIPFLVLPMYQFPHFVPDAVRTFSPHVMLAIYWGCSVLGGLSGANEIVSLTVESLLVDTTSPHERSHLFRLVQVAQLLGASIGPLLGSVATQWMPFAHNRCIGYRTCQPTHDSKDGLKAAPLFNNAPYWLSLCFVLLCLGWTLVAVDFRHTSQKKRASHDEAHLQTQSQPALRYRWLGAFQRLVPVRVGQWSYDTRIAKLVAADMCVAFSTEGPVVLILVLGYVFHWDRNLLSLGLGVTNALKLVTMAVLLPLSLHAATRLIERPDEIKSLSHEQLHMCMDLSDEELSRESDEVALDPQQAPLLRPISHAQCIIAHLWRAQVDLDVSRLSFFINSLSWLVIALSLEWQSQALVIVGALLLTSGSGAQALLRSAASTMSDRIIEQQDKKATSLTHTTNDAHPLPRGSDSYLVIVSTLLLPCLLLGLALRNYIYTHTVATHPGTFFVWMAVVNGAALLLLCMVRPVTS